METSFGDCRRELLSKVNAHGRSAYEQWRRRDGYQDVVRFVEGFTHRFIYTLHPADMQNAIDRTGHALGDVRKEEAITAIQDFTCPFALHHIFHQLLESKQAIPLWEDLDAHIHGQANDKWWDPLRDAVGSFPEIQQLITVHGREEAWRRIQRAVRWRLGNFYLSAMRELDLFVRLRHMGVSLRYHVLADVLLRVDFWTPDTLLCVYFLNSRYRGRKKETERFFSGVPVTHAKFERQGFGNMARRAQTVDFGWQFEMTEQRRLQKYGQRPGHGEMRCQGFSAAGQLPISSTSAWRSRARLIASHSPMPSSTARLLSNVKTRTLSSHARRRSRPCPYFGRCVGMLHFSQYRVGDKDTAKETWKKFRVSEENEVIQGTGIGNNDHTRAAVHLSA